MKIKFTGIFPASLILLFFASCGPAVLPATPTALSSSTASPLAMLTDTPVCDGLCPSDSMTATAAMGLTFAAIPTNTPPPWATIIPEAGDLGWGSVYGIIVDGATLLPIEGATVTCEHTSDRSPYLCDGTTITNSDGIYSFAPVFFHETDRITLIVEAPGYLPLRFEETFFTRADVQLNLGLFPVNYVTETPTSSTQAPTPFVMCTAPACVGGELSCGDPNGCPGGCGTVCLTATPTP